MLFTANKYTRWYYNIVDRATTRVLATDSHYEKHHIIPKSLGGNNSKDNLVKLLAREHFICHWLLTKITTGVNKKKMAYACKMMMHSNGKGQARYKITSRVYATLRQNLNAMLKDREFTDEWRAKLKVAARKRADNEDATTKQIRRDNMINANIARKGETRLATTGNKNHFYGKGFFGADNHFYGKKHSEETLAKMRIPRLKYVCQHCNTTVGGKSNYNRWHGNNCKLLIGEQNA
ncbi:HNHc domain containing protein [uncultured Caudovirales phage]|uniref:HNHc domain containing protein n=1 Tax=uncultured Caudovirales phage TaxID=2100421 RepID=A0A6J5R0Y9_9CAUD|nr:HNHc domain containing protein [uncultured Caudovirales phage]CAB4165683.1 HNHc domain containing protein [uncultured Caudovirales phage]CAB4186635.1 HNHc domain containing protein [uncultured Caudovirales phage]CAB4221043.1 HNHc domain containing protein [uncultured Caudovirales phage]